MTERKVSRQTLAEAETLGVNVDDVKGELLDGVETVRPAHVRDHKKELDRIEPTPSTDDVEPIISKTPEQLAVQAEQDALDALHAAEKALIDAKSAYGAAVAEKNKFQRKLSLADIHQITLLHKARKLGKAK